jgi:sulfite reductase alpha subunit-like flavoprotein
LVKEHGQAVYEALAECGGLVFVCGSSGRMPQAVRHALTEVFQVHGNMVIADAEAYLVKMEKEGRYKQETW